VQAAGEYAERFKWIEKACPRTCIIIALLQRPQAAWQ
jgi:hypothetical protein